MEDGSRWVMLAGAAAFMMAMMAGASFLLRDMRGQERFSQRVRQIHGEARVTQSSQDRQQMKEVFSRTIAGIGQMILSSGMVPAATRGQLETMLRGAGIRGEQSVGVFFGTKLMLMGGLPVIAWLMSRGGFSGMIGLFIPVAAGIVGLVLPDLIVKQLQKRFMAKLLKGLPDALDMMVICAQAGLGLAPAIIRVADEMKMSYRELAIEFSLTANELQIMSDTRLALHNFGHRCGLEAFRRLAMTLIQTIQYGTPLTDALRTLSAEMRQEALTAFEESAARLPTMLTLPMILFILPCVFLIAGGPAAIQVMHAMS